jgi:hypothetical protein
MEYKEIISASKTIRCFEFSGKFAGQLYLYFDSLDVDGMIETTCIIETPHGRYSTISKISTSFLKDHEPYAFERLFSKCVERYKRELNFNPQK